MARDLDLLWDKATGALSFATTSAARTVGNYMKRGETLTISVTVQADGASSTIPATTVCTLKPVNAYNTTLCQWSSFAQVGATNVYTASATLNSADINTLLGTTIESWNCVLDFAGSGVTESDTLAIVLKNNVTRDSDTAPTVLVARNDFLVESVSGVTVSIRAGILSTGASVAAQSALVLTNNATNYVEMNASGVASANTSGYTDAYYPLALVVTSAGAITSNTDRRPWVETKGGGGGVTSVAQSFTGGLISVAGSPITTSGTLALTVAGTSGGIPYFSSATTWATSAALAANALVIGGGAGAAPSTTTTGTGVLTALGITVNTLGGVLTTIPTGKTLWVDSVNGSDANAGTLRYPLLTLAAAKSAAASGDLICVGPGTYAVTDSILKNGVNWDFAAGATVTMTQNASAVGILDDKGAAVTCNVTGQGTFAVSSTATGGGAIAGNLYTVRVSHASSVVNVNALDITITGTGTTATTWGAASGEAGTLTVNARNLTITGTSGIPNVVNWNNGTMRVKASQINGAYGVWSGCSATPTGELYVEAEDISSATCIYGDGTNADAVAWIRAKTVRGTAESIRMHTTTPNANRVYVQCEKLYGTINSGGGLLYVNADKHTAVSNGTISGIGSFITSATSGTGDAYLSIRHMDVSTFTGTPIRLAGGKVRLFGAQLVGTSSTTAIVSNTVGNNGPHLFSGCNFDLSAATVDALEISRATVNVENCRITSNAANKDIAQSVAGTVNVSGGWGTGTNGNFTTSGTVNYKEPSATIAASTTGSAATLTTARTIGGSSFNGSANVTSFPEPGAIGGTTPSTGAFTTLTGTSSLTLGVASTTDGSLVLHNAANAFTTTIKTGVTGASYTLTLPTTDGDASQVLTTNGSGVLSWSTPSSATGADPTGTIGLTAVNGVASTFTRSDGAPALSQAIAPTWTGVHTFVSAPSANTATTALLLTDTTAATSGNQQYSGALRFTGQGWKTNATAASQAVDTRMYVVPIQGTANPTQKLVIDNGVNGGAFSEAVAIYPSGTATSASSNGTAVITGGLGVSGNIMSGSSVSAPAYHWTNGSPGFASRNGGTGEVTIITNASNLILQPASGIVALGVSTASGASIKYSGTAITAGLGDGTAGGSFTASGKLITTPQALSGAGAVNVTTAATAFTSTGVGDALTLADGTEGQIKTVCHVVDGGSGILTPTTKSGYTTITFTNVGDSVTLQFHTTAGWCIIGIFGAVAA